MPVCISRRGSDRATAYNISSKIIRRRDRLFIGWLNAPDVKGGPVEIRLGICHGDSGRLLDSISLGQGVDNHCGPALILDHNERFHTLIGSHHGPFLYRWSDTPEAEDTWSAPEPVGASPSYPALAADGAGTLHLAYRHKGERWQLHYTRKRQGRPWEAPTVIAESPVPGYNHFMHGLSMGPTGRLHLTFQFHYSDTENAMDGKGRAAGYVSSDDGGDTWLHEDQSVALPLTTKTLQPFVSCLDNPDGSIRIAPHTVDERDRPWLFCAVEDRGLLWRREPSGWISTDLKDALPKLDLSIGKATAISSDPDGRIHLLVATDPAARAKGWYDPALELFHLVFNGDGTPAAKTQITPTDPRQARWLPAIEHHDWLRPGLVGKGGHWCLYTAGLNAGLMNRQDYDDGLRNDVFLTRLEALT